MKSFLVTTFFPEVKPAHAAWQVCEVKAGNIGLAAARALRLIRARESIRGKRISNVQVTIKELPGGVASKEQ